MRRQARSSAVVRPMACLQVRDRRDHAPPRRRRPSQRGRTYQLPDQKGAASRVGAGALVFACRDAAASAATRSLRARRERRFALRARAREIAVRTIEVAYTRCLDRMSSIQNQGAGVLGVGSQPGGTVTIGLTA